LKLNCIEPLSNFAFIMHLRPSKMARRGGDCKTGVVSMCIGSGMVWRCRLTLSKLKLKPPGAKHLKLNCDMLLSTFFFKLILRRYSMGAAGVFEREA